MQRSAPIDGFSLAYERHGDGAEAVVLLHGWPGDRQDWREVVPRLVAGGRATVVVPDLRGFGASDTPPAEPPEAYAAAGQAAGVLGLMRELGLRSAVIAGYDVGSRVAQQIAREAPGRGPATRPTPRSSTVWPRSTAPPAPEDRIAVPTTVLWPGHDPLFPVQWSDRIDEFFGAATLRSLPDAGHFSPLEAPADFAEAIADALGD